jgi:hypothetical protein
MATSRVLAGGKAYFQRAGLGLDGVCPVASKPVNKSPHRVTRPSEDRARREHGGYIESPKKLERQFADGLERTRLRLEQQREEIRRLAAIRRAGSGVKT